MLNLDFSNFSEKDILFHAIRLSKENNPENYFCLSNEFPEVENFILNINNNFTKNEKFDLFSTHKKFNLNLDYNKIRKYFDNSKDIGDELILLNKYFKKFIYGTHFKVYTAHMPL